MKRLVYAGLILAIAMAMCPRADALVVLRTSVMGCGGEYVSDPNYDHWCTIGQAAIGRAGNAFYLHHAGFWYPTSYHYSEVLEPRPGLPIEFALGYGTPNPLSAAGSIVYAVPTQSHVAIRLFDVTGRQLQTLVNGHVEPGYHEARLRPQGLSGGMYFCRMDAEGFTATKRFVLLR